MKKYIIIIIAILSTSSTLAQEDVNFVFFPYARNIYNPAFAGKTSEGPDFLLSYRSQWAGIQGAPETKSANFNTPIGKKIGLGVSILNNQIFVETQTQLAVDVSYGININEKDKLYFGLKAGANNYQLNTAGLETYGFTTDASLQDFESRFTPNFGAGAVYEGSNYFFSVAIPQLFNSERVAEENGTAITTNDMLKTYIMAGYTFGERDRLAVETTGLYKIVKDAPAYYELTAIVDFGFRFDLGVTYRNNTSFAGLFLFKISNSLNFGYAYEAPLNTRTNNMNSVSNELFFRLTL